MYHISKTGTATIVDCVGSVGLIRRHECIVSYQQNWYWGSNILYRLCGIGTGAVVFCIISVGRTGAVEDCIISVGLVLVQLWTVSYQ